MQYYTPTLTWLRDNEAFVQAYHKSLGRGRAHDVHVRSHSIVLKTSRYEYIYHIRVLRRELKKRMTQAKTITYTVPNVK
jgi:hypothetical protein